MEPRSTTLNCLARRSPRRPGQAPTSFLPRQCLRSFALRNGDQREDGVPLCCIWGSVARRGLATGRDSRDIFCGRSSVARWEVFPSITGEAYITGEAKLFFGEKGPVSVGHFVTGRRINSLRCRSGGRGYRRCGLCLFSDAGGASGRSTGEGNYWRRGDCGGNGAFGRDGRFASTTGFDEAFTQLGRGLLEELPASAEHRETGTLWIAADEDEMAGGAAEVWAFTALWAPCL